MRTTPVDAEGMDAFLKFVFLRGCALRREVHDIELEGCPKQVRKYYHDGVLVAQGVYRRATVHLSDPWVMESGHIFEGGDRLTQ